MILTVFLAGMFAGMMWLYLCSFAGRFFGRYSPEVKRQQAYLNALTMRLNITKWKNMLDASKRYHDSLN